MKHIVPALVLSLTILTQHPHPSLTPPPPSPKRPVTDVYHGVKVVDDYRWLENNNFA
jgi:hypothetical protein